MTARFCSTDRPYRWVTNTCQTNKIYFLWFLTWQVIKGLNVLDKNIGLLSRAFALNVLWQVIDYQFSNTKEKKVIGGILLRLEDTTALIVIWTMIQESLDHLHRGLHHMKGCHNGTVAHLPKRHKYWKMTKFPVWLTQPTRADWFTGTRWCITVLSPVSILSR